MEQNKINSLLEESLEIVRGNITTEPRKDHLIALLIEIHHLQTQLQLAQIYEHNNN